MGTEDGVTTTWTCKHCDVALTLPGADPPDGWWHHRGLQESVRIEGKRAERVRQHGWWCGCPLMGY